jgi:hypothetical protein
MEAEDVEMVGGTEGDRFPTIDSVDASTSGVAAFSKTSSLTIFLALCVAVQNFFIWSRHDVVRPIVSSPIIHEKFL